jgi:hypothetical protein
MRKWMAGAAACLLVVMACGGDGDDTSGAGTDVQSDATPAAASEAAATAAPAGAPRASDAANTRATAKPASGSTTQASSAPAKPASPGAVNRPKTGRYTAKVSGEATDPFTGQRQPVPDGARAFTDLSASGVEYTSKITNNQMAGDTTTKTRWESARVLLLLFSINQPVVKVRCDYDPPLVILQLPVKKQTYAPQTRKDGTDCTQTTAITVAGQETAKAMGRDWATWKITQKTTYSFNNASITGTLNQTLWLSPELGVAIKTDETNNGTYKTTAGSQKIFSHTRTELIERP